MAAKHKAITGAIFRAFSSPKSPRLDSINSWQGSVVGARIHTTAIKDAEYLGTSRSIFHSNYSHSIMRATISTTTTRLSHQSLPSFRSQFLQHGHQLRHFAKWTPYKPLPKPKLHQKLRAIKTLKAHLQDSYFISPFPCHGFSANKFKPLKTPISSDPSAAKLVFVKNSLVSKAFSGTQFEALGSCMKGMNSLLFVKKEEAVGPAMGGVKNAVKEGKLEFNDFPGAVVGGQLYGHLDLEVFQSTPSKMEAHGMLLGSLFGPSSTLMAVLEGFGTDDAKDGGTSDVPAGVESEAKDVSESPSQ